MDIRFDSVTARQTVTPIQATANALHKPADEPAESTGEATGEATDRAARAPAVAHLHERIQTLHRELRFRVDESTGLTVVRVVEAETGDLIRQIPAQSVLEMHAARESSRGQLLREQA